VNRRRLCVIGLDCAAPELVFEQLTPRLPNLSGLMRRGRWGRLRSTDPPITVPAWVSMASGLDPGQLGLYGFRNRPDHSYAPLALASAQGVGVPRLWDMASQAGLCSVVLGLPLTWPASAVRGAMVAGFPLPENADGLTWPRSLGPRLERWGGGPYIVDVPDFRRADRAALAQTVRTMVQRRFAVARGLWRLYDPDLLWLVEMGTDRMHHAFWRHHDPLHRLHQPGSPLAGAIASHYEDLDAQIGLILAELPPETLVLVVSDHGARRLEGGLCINQWLLERGLLRLRVEPAEGAPLAPAMIDWPRTKVWSDGGYYARIFCNVAGREPQGAVDPAAYDAFLAELRAELEAMPGPDGRPLGNRVVDPRQAYAAVNGAAPDLLLYPGDLAWRAVGQVWPRGGPLFVQDNDSGPDDANHSPEGLFIAAPAAGQALAQAGRQHHGATLYDVCPTACAWLGLDPPAKGRGRPWPWLDQLDRPRGR